MCNFTIEFFKLLGIGEGAELRSPLAITVMGGLLVSTFLTLVVIPSVYLIVDEFLVRRRKKRIVASE